MKIKNQKEILKNKTEFYEILIENTRNYEGKFKEIVIHSPKIYNLLCELIESNRLSKKYRNYVCSAIAYFILPKDIFPENIFGAKGYIDDIYLSLYVLKEIEKEYEIEEILDHWKYDLDLLKKLLERDFKLIDEEFGYILTEILEYVGIK
ncbi:MAG: DUF1232 domain-containing protein [Candidatus Firestonebacteria bacterium]